MVCPSVEIIIAYRNDLPSDTVTGDETCKGRISESPIEGRARGAIDRYEESWQQPWRLFLVFFVCGGAGMRPFSNIRNRSGFRSRRSNIDPCIRYSVLYSYMFEELGIEELLYRF